MTESFGLWSAPSECKVCRHPIPSESEICFRCGTPQRVFSATSAKFLWGQLAAGAKNLLEIFVHLALISAGLYFCFTVSPLVVLLPLFFALTARPGSQ